MSDRATWGPRVKGEYLELGHFLTREKTFPNCPPNMRAWLTQPSSHNSSLAFDIVCQVTSGHYQGLLFVYPWVTLCQIHKSQMWQLTQTRLSDQSHAFWVSGLCPFIKQFPPNIQVLKKKNPQVGCAILRLAEIDFQAFTPTPLIVLMLD